MKKKYSPSELPAAFCPLPWTQLATSVRGFVRLCCNTTALRQTDGSRLVLGGPQTVTEVWNSPPLRAARKQMLSGKLPELCQFCSQIEARGHTSKRNSLNKRQPDWLGDLKELIASTSPEGALPHHPVSLDLRLGNVCNLKCVMCRPDTSSKWVRDFELLQRQSPLPQSASRFLQHPEVPEGSHEWYESCELLEFIKTHGSGLRRLHFSGGEPLLIPMHKEILLTCVKQGYASQIRLSYDTNGTQIDSEWLRLWENFAAVELNISIDGVADTFEYIRYPAKWQDFVDQMTLLAQWRWPGYSVRWIITAQILNIFDYRQIFDWVSQMKLSLSGDHRHQILWNSVRSPECLSVATLPDALLKEIHGEIDEQIAAAPSDPKSSERLALLSSLKQHLTVVSRIQANERPELSDFLQYVAALDQVRGTDWQRAAPRLAQALRC